MKACDLFCDTVADAPDRMLARASANAADKAARPAVRVSPAGACSEVDAQLPVEHMLDVVVNGALLMHVTCTPTHMRELIVGRLYTEGVIDSADDVAAIEFSEDGSKARVGLADATRDFAGRSVTTVPTYGASSREYAEKLGSRLERLSADAFSYDADQVFCMARMFARDTPVHHATNGVHSCYMAVDGQVRYCCEDLGRHNALDKVIGCALLARDDLSRALVFSSGRIPVDMVSKVIRAGIPVLVTKAVPTDLAVSIAREAGLVLICQARPDSFVVFNDGRR